MPVSEPRHQTGDRRKKGTHLILTPPLNMYLVTFWETQESAAEEEEEMSASISLGIPTMTSIPLPMSALSTSGSASNSFTFRIWLSLRRSTTVGGDSLCRVMVPQFTPIADSAGAAASSRSTDRRWRMLQRFAILALSRKPRTKKLREGLSGCSSKWKCRSTTQYEARER